uniref:KTSC domain-containing protein n=1 Tax=Echinococcus granulosus TaxID=6210 RepID=A0A068X540_ECHGR|nr:hypothetical protein EgrG_002055200 [Echinococcus granulosus]
MTIIFARSEKAPLCRSTSCSVNLFTRDSLVEHSLFAYKSTQIVTIVFGPDYTIREINFRDYSAERIRTKSLMPIREMYYNQQEISTPYTKY